ncbi:MAG: alpha/beta hydrolase [Candidatus Aminicenantaceae bacterium]
MAKSMKRHGEFFQRLMLWSAVLLILAGCGPKRERSSIEFNITLSEEAFQAMEKLGMEIPLKGRVFAIVSRDEQKEPRLSTGVRGVPFWGMDVRDWRGGEQITIEDGKESVKGYPLEKTWELPPGDYFVQAFVNVYTTFHRADGHTVEMHLNSGAHQSPFRAPGNVTSEVIPVSIGSGKKTAINLTLNRVIQPPSPLKEGEVLQQGNYTDTEWVKYIKIKSEKISRFWGRDMYLGANILLPKGYHENPDVHYPVLYLQGHSSGFTPVPWSPEEWFREDYTPSHPAVGNQLDGFYKAWTSGSLPKMIVVTFRDSNPYFDTSYSVNSPNVGPYGDALIHELIPHIESNFRIIPQPWARVTAGRSTGGWEAAALMINHPGFFAGSWPWAPDPVDFRKLMQINIYKNRNAFFNEFEWIRTERPAQREIDGLVNYTVRDEYRWEQAVGDKDRSAGQWAVWQAVYSPAAADGYPVPLWDPETGKIDPEVAEFWRENADLSAIIDKTWSEKGPQLRGKLHFAVGMMDNYYLNEAVYLIQEVLESQINPPSGATFQYGFRGRHSWIGHSPRDPERQMTYAEFISVIADYIHNHAPSGADKMGWKYQ